MKFGVDPSRMYSSWGQGFLKLYLLYGIGWCLCWVGLVAVWRARLSRRVLLAAQLPHPQYWSPSRPKLQYSKLRHSPSRYVFVYNPPRPSPRNRHVVRVTCTCTSSYPLKPHVTRFPLFRNFQLRLSRLEPKHHALLRAATALFVQPFTRNSYELNGIESEAFSSLNRLFFSSKMSF